METQSSDVAWVDDSKWGNTQLETQFRISGYFKIKSYLIRYHIVFSVGRIDQGNQKLISQSVMQLKNVSYIMNLDIQQVISDNISLI